MQIRENPYSGIFYVLLDVTYSQLELERNMIEFIWIDKSNWSKF